MAPKRPDRLLSTPHDAFWQWCEQGELRIQKCTACGELCWPTTEACEACGGASFDWEKMSGEGSVVSWCTFEKDYYQGAFPMPWTNILVALAEGPWFLSEAGNFAADELAPGLPVKLAFKRCTDSSGAFNLPVFDRR